MTRVANYAQHLLNLSYLSATQTRIKDSQIAVSSGKVAQSYDKLGVDAHQLLSLERSSVRAEQYIKNIDRAIGRLDITESTLATMTDRATYLLGQLAISINADNADSVALDEIGGGFLQEVASLLNVRHGDRYLFAGSRGDIAPVDLTGYDPTATWPPAAPGAVDTSYYQGDGVTAVARADDSFELDYGTTADQDGFEKLMRALSYTKWAGLNPADPNRAAVLSAALDLTREAIGDLSRIRSDVGANYSVLEQTKLRHQQFMTYADTAISDIEDTDLAEAVTRISNNQTQLEASYLTLARLQSVSLLDFLR